MAFLKKSLPLLILIFLISSFFARLFFPTLKMPVTPDFGRSDILHLNYPLKNFLSESLKNGELPLWNPQIGTGFPQLAEGQIGTFNVFNLFFFGLFPMPLAYNLALVVIYLTAGISTYFFARAIKLGLLASFFAGFLFTFSGFMIAHLQHFNLAQTASFLPLELLLIELLIQKKKVVWFLVFFPFVVSQQYFSGFPQVALYSVTAAIGYSILRLFFEHKDWRAKKISIVSVILILSLLLSLALSAIQLLPSREYLSYSTRPEGLSASGVDSFPYYPSNLLAFFYPYIHGNPSSGTYPPFGPAWGIFWENTGYIGILPLILAGLGIILAFCRKGKKKYLFSFFLIALVSILLVLGKFSPFFFLFSIPPFNIFRVPQRFLLPVDFSLVILAAFGFSFLLEKIKKAKLKFLVATIIIAISIFDISWTWWDYHPLVEARRWLEDPPTAKFLKKDPDDFRIISLLSFQPWNSTFLTKGWKNNLENYRQFRSSLDPNMNMVFGISNTWAYESLLTRRLAFFGQLYEKRMGTEEQSSSLTLLSISNVKYLVAPFEIEDENLEKVFQTNHGQNKTIYYIYKNKNVKERVQLASNAIVSPNIDDLVLELVTKNDNEVVIEKELGKSPVQKRSEETGSAKIEKKTNQKIEIAADLENETFLVLADSYYPGWKAYVDGKKREILAANLNQKAIRIEPGKHQVIFIFESETYKKGIVVSIFALILILSLPKVLSRIFPKGVI